MGFWACVRTHAPRSRVRGERVNAHAYLLVCVGVCLGECVCEMFGLFSCELVFMCVCLCLGVQACGSSACTG